jgi:MFS family permease
VDLCVRGIQFAFLGFPLAGFLTHYFGWQYVYYVCGKLEIDLETIFLSPMLIQVLNPMHKI